MPEIQDQAKVTIKKLIAKYEAVKAADKIRDYSEEDTKKDFILPLFEALGWEVDNRTEVTAEEQISGDRVDYGFYLNGRIKFYLEAKPLKADLHREEYAKQAIKYSWNKGVTWAVLTDFESLKVFNAMSTERSLGSKLYFEIPYSDYVSRFDQLWQLSKTAFATDFIDIEARKVGKLLQKISVGDQLYKDLNECRTMLTDSFKTSNDKLKDQHLIDEGVQRLLNRLIFIRVAEDRKVEPPTLMPLINQWVANKRHGTLFAAMIQKFRELDKTYNSSLFAEHPFEDWEEVGVATEKVIDILYGKKGYVEYDFAAIPADVLGAVYENYLGYKLQQSEKKDLFGSHLELSKDSRKRKEQGIYYTPPFIVDYIVKNALGPVLDRCRSVNDLKQIRVLDPACGSGSFLIRAMDMIAEKYKEFGASKVDANIKIQILLNNIYGVDLDEQAVEIARLNLLLNTFDAQTKLPDLYSNIKNGNSLISGTDDELEKYFGKNFRDKKPFNWEEEFPEVFKQGGFDCIIGNPPYLDSEEMVKSQPDVRNFFSKKYNTARGNWDLFIVFIELGLNLLRKNGQLGLIIPNKLLSASYAKETRKYMAGQKIRRIKDFSDLRVFTASVYPIVIVVEKEATNDKDIFISEPASGEQIKIPNISLQNSTGGWSFIFDESNNFQGLFSKFKTIADYFELRSAATVSEAYDLKNILKDGKLTGKVFKFINTGTIDPFISLWGIYATTYIKNNYKEPVVSEIDLEKLMPRRYKVAKLPKIIVAGMSKRIEAFFDSQGDYLAGKSTAVITGKTDDLKFLIGILNSEFFTTFFNNNYKSLSMQGGYLNISAPLLSVMPIPDPKGNKNFIKLVDLVLDLYGKLAKLSENSNEWKKLKSEIEKIDKKIDDEVYKLYGLTSDEIKIIEKTA